LEEHKKKICFVSPNIYKLFNKNSNVKYGGSEVQIYLISKELSEKSDFNVSVDTGNKDMKKRTIEKIKKLIIYNFI
jgi:hypothetical protein